MIYGIGIDVLKIDRIERVYGKHGERFVDHLLMPAEREQLLQTSRPVSRTCFTSANGCASAMDSYQLRSSTDWSDCSLLAARRTQLPKPYPPPTASRPGKRSHRRWAQNCR